MNILSSAATLLLAPSGGWNMLLVAALILVCPLGMWMMMRGMNRSGNAKDVSDKSELRGPGTTHDGDKRKY